MLPRKQLSQTHITHTHSHTHTRFSLLLCRLRQVAWPPRTTRSTTSPPPTSPSPSCPPTKKVRFRGLLPVLSFLPSLFPSTSSSVLPTFVLGSPLPSFMSLYFHLAPFLRFLRFTSFYIFPSPNLTPFPSCLDTLHFLPSCPSFNFFLIAPCFLPSFLSTFLP